MAGVSKGVELACPVDRSDDASSPSLCFDRGSTSLTLERREEEPVDSCPLRDEKGRRIGGND